MAHWITVGDKIINLDLVVDIVFYEDAAVGLTALLHHVAPDYRQGMLEPGMIVLEAGDAEALRSYLDARADVVQARPSQHRSQGAGNGRVRRRPKEQAS